MQKGNRSAFPLIELLLVIAIIATLVIIVFAALNPVKKFQDTKTSRRRKDIETILTAINLYSKDNEGDLPSGVSRGMTERQLGSASSGCSTTGGGCNVANKACLDVASDLAPYLKNFPTDPTEATSSGKTGYSLKVDSNGIATLRACLSEDELIYISR